MAPFSERCRLWRQFPLPDRLLLIQAHSDNNRVVIKKFVAGKDPALG